jgi:TonB family protein
MKTFPALIPCFVMCSILSATAIAAAVMDNDVPQENARKDDPQRTKAIVKSKPEPNYPEEARKRRIEATVVLRAIFRASGEVTDIKFAKVIPENLPDDVVQAFTNECIRVARQIKFEPAMKDGHPVSMYVQLEYNFRPD